MPDEKRGARNPNIAYAATKNEYDFYRKSTADPLTGKPATARLRELYSSKSFRLLCGLLRFADKIRGIPPVLPPAPPKEDPLMDAGGRATRKPRIALVVDAHGWAFDNVAGQLVKRLAGQYSLTIFYLNDEECSHVAKVMFALRDFDLVHVFWRGYIGNMTSEWCREYIRDMGGDFEAFLREYYEPLKISTCVADPLLFNGEYTDEAGLVLRRAHCYYTTSQKLFDLYTGDARFPNPTMIIHDYVDFTIFYPKNPGRFAETGQGPLRVGWAGNSVWNAHGAGPDLKGIHTIITPAVQSLQNQGYAVELVLADRKNGFIPHKEMPDFYNSIDVYVCASTQEGTPNPILEAMACGVPIISTDVGVVPEVLGKEQQAFIMPQRDPNALEALLKKLIADPTLMQVLSTENLASIQPWNWDIGINRYRKYFDYVLFGAQPKMGE